MSGGQATTKWLSSVPSPNSPSSTISARCGSKASTTSAGGPDFSAIIGQMAKTVNEDGKTVSSTDSDVCLEQVESPQLCCQR